MKAKKTAPKKKTTALARTRPRPRSYPGQTLLAPVTMARGVQVLPPENVAKYGQLTEHMELGALGLVEIKLTDKEELVLNRPVNVDDIRVIPDDGGVIYLPHAVYTRWFNEAFGRLGWQIVPCSKPSLQGDTVNCPYVLHIHGRPAAFAVGEQDWKPTNKRMSYGDAFEATVASALRRCAKRLGVGLELWDKAFGARYLAEHCVLVRAQGRDGVYRAWRRKVDPPLSNEIVTNRQAQEGAQEPRGEDRDERGGRQARTFDAPQGGAARPAAGTAGGQVPITEQQVKRFWAILRNSGRNEEVVRDWLKVRFGYDHVTDIKRGQYDRICEAIEGEGKLG